MNKTLLKHALMSISKSKSRFLSIFCIIALGVGFLTGLKASAPDMKLSADKYYDDTNLAHFKLVSTYGFTEKDVEALEALDFPKNVYPTYFTDALAIDGDTGKAVRVMSLKNPGETNEYTKLTLSEGRFPEKPNECIIDNSSYRNGGAVGDTITLSSGNDKDINDTLNNTEFTVVGIFSSPAYISNNSTDAKGSTTIGNGTISSLLYVLEEDFTSDYYTEIYITVPTLFDLEAYSTEYDTLSTELQQKMEDVADVQTVVRFKEVKDEVDEKIADGEKEIADGEKKLKDAENELFDGKDEIDAGTEKLETAKKDLIAAEKELNDGRTELTDGKKELADKEEEFNTKIADGEKEIADNEKKLQEGAAEYKKGLAKYTDGITAYNDGVTQYNSGAAEIAANKQLLSEKQAEYDAGFAKYNQGLIDIKQLEEAVSAGLAPSEMLTEARAKLEEAKKQLDSGKEMLKAGKEELKKGEETLVATKAVLESSKKELDAAKNELSSSKKTIEDGFATLNKAKADFVTAKADGVKQLRAAKDKIATGEAEYNDGLAAFEDGKIKVSEAEKELSDANVTYADGLNKYNEEKAKADKELTDARIKIADAKEEAGKLKEPVWYVNERNDDAVYAEYNDNSKRIDNITSVFPLFFILIAGLVVLTTMSRMVEDERIEVGTLKALGYSNGKIIFKYILYAVTATLAGCVLGCVGGMQLFPRVIMVAYGMMYNIPVVLAPFRWDLAAVSTAAALLAVILVVYFSCKAELSEQPSQLMRPKPPGSGKRVLVEKIPFIWNHLNFSNKVTVRNIFRYKRRMLMTIIGISGCTALTLTGFALKDSIGDILYKQYDEITLYDGMAAYDNATDAAEGETVLKQNGVDYLPVYQKNFEVKSNGKTVKAFIVVPQDEKEFTGYIDLRDRVSGKKYTLEGDGVVVTEKMATLLGVKVGDDITIGSSGEQLTTLTIGAITENYPYHYVYINEKLYNEKFAETPDYSMLYFKQNGVEKEALSTTLIENKALMVNFNEDTKVTFRSMIKALDMVIVVIILCAGALAFVVLFNLTSININERIREISTLKVLGFYDKEVDSYIFRENFLLTALGAGAGLILGQFLATFIITTAEIDMTMFGRAIHPLSFVYAGLVTLLFAVVVTLCMHTHLIKVNMIDALKSVE